jgi:hypothetical protein
VDAMVADNNDEVMKKLDEMQKSIEELKKQLKNEIPKTFRRRM